MQRKHLRRWPRNDLAEKTVILDIPIQKETLQILLPDLPVFREMQSGIIERTGSRTKETRRLTSWIRKFGKKMKEKKNI